MARENTFTRRLREREQELQTRSKREEKKSTVVHEQPMSIDDMLVRAKVQCGESVDDFSFAQFHRMIAAKTEALKERLGCERVRYSVYLDGGRVSFKAK